MNTTIMDVNRKMKESIKTMKYVDTEAFRELIKNEKFDDALKMIDEAKAPNVTTEQKDAETESKQKRKYTKKS